MKKFFSLVALCTLTHIIGQAQPALNFSIGNSLPLGANLLATEYTSSSSSATATTTTNQKGVYGTFGTGWNFTASYTLPFSKNFGLDIAASYFLGSTITNKYTYTATGFSSVEVDNGHTSGWLLSPALVLKTEPVKSLQPYAKFGFVLGSVRFDTEQNITDKITSGTPTTTTTNRVREYTGGLPFGLKGGLGVIFSADKKTSFFTELTFTSMSYYPSKSVLTSYKVNGVENLSTLTESAKTTVYKREITSTGTAPSSSQPTESISQSLPMGTVLLSIGVNIKLGSANP